MRRPLVVLLLILLALVAVAKKRIPDDLRGAWSEPGRCNPDHYHSPNRDTSARTADFCLCRRL